MRRTVDEPHEGEVEQLPVGRTAWGESWLVLPGKPGCTSYRNVFTGKSIRPVRDQNGIPGSSWATSSESVRWRC